MRGLRNIQKGQQLCYTVDFLELFPVALGKKFFANFELIKASVMLKSNAHLASIHTQVPTYGIFENISSISQLAAMPQWTEDRPLRVVTGYTYVRPISPCS
jgi:hypothetical protein